MIRDVRIADAGRIADIYNYYIENTAITFENDLVNIEEIQNRIRKICSKGYPFLVYEKKGELIGYAYLNNWRERTAYDKTLETSVYLDKDITGNGIGAVLYEELIERARKINVHSLIGVISLPNESSQKLHQRFRFQLVGNFRESGIKFGKLIDVEFWQLIL
jgi:phosphinothricin acetyltransferase